MEQQGLPVSIAIVMAAAILGAAIAIGMVVASVIAKG